MKLVANNPPVKLPKKTPKNQQKSSVDPSAMGFGPDTVWLQYPAEALEKMDITPEMSSRLVSVKNISLSTTYDDLHKYFGSFGEIDRIKINGVKPGVDFQMANTLVKVEGLVRPTRNSIAAFILYQDEEIAKHVADTDGLVLKGNHLSVVRKQRDFNDENENNSIFVTNLRKPLVEEELWSVFESFGPIKHVRVIVRYHEYQLSQGVITFINSHSVQVALNLKDPIKLRGSKLGIYEFNSKKAAEEEKETKTKLVDPDNEEDDDSAVESDESDSEVVPLKLETQEDENDDDDDDDDDDDIEDVPIIKKSKTEKGPKRIITKKNKKEKTNPKKLILQKEAVTAELLDKKKNGGSKGVAKKKIN